MAQQSSNFPRDKYEKVRQHAQNTPENEVKISSNSQSISKYITYTAGLLLEKKLELVILKASGLACRDAVQVAEILRHNITSLHQESKITTVDVTDEYEPLEEGLEKLQIKRKIAVLEIKLSKKASALSESAPGYQKPLEVNAEQETELKDMVEKRMSGEGRGEYRGRGGRGRGRGDRGYRGRGRGFRGGYRGGDRGDDREDRVDREDQGDRGDREFRGGYRGGNRGGYRGGDRGGYRGGDRGGYRGGDRGGYRGGDRGGYRGGDREGGFRGGYRGDRGFRGGRGRGGRGRGGYGRSESGSDSGRDAPKTYNKRPQTSTTTTESQWK